MLLTCANRHSQSDICLQDHKQSLVAPNDTTQILAIPVYAITSEVQNNNNNRITQPKRPITLLKF